VFHFWSGFMAPAVRFRHGKSQSTPVNLDS
jgi:hypothetical protein